MGAFRFNARLRGRVRAHYAHASRACGRFILPQQFAKPNARKKAEYPGRVPEPSAKRAKTLDLAIARGPFWGSAGGVPRCFEKI